MREYNKVVTEFRGLIYDSLTIEMFEQNWSNFLLNFELEANDWLVKLYSERRAWVPVYLNDIFWAGMVSTQRSESMHAFFDGYINTRSTLKQFVEQYNIALSDKIQKEFEVDHDYKHKKILCLSSFTWEKAFQRVFTNAIFNLIQE